MQRYSRLDMPDGRKPIEEAWNGFAKFVLPLTVSDVQRADMRTSFYAGALALFATFMSEANDGEDETTQANLDLMRDVEAELKCFALSSQRH
jgi:hypothetical protein